MSLLDDEAGADAYYGFPAGTMAALGTSESSQGANLGSLGNIFQVTPSTAAQPGYGLSGVDGNNPMSAGAYLNALYQGPAGGNMASAMSLYQTGSPNPGYTGNTAMASYLAGLGPAGASTGSTGAIPSMSIYPDDQAPPDAVANTLAGGAAGTSAVPGAAGAASSAAGGTPGVPGTSSGLTAKDITADFPQWLKEAGAWLAGFGTRAALILLAIIILLAAAYLFASRTQGTTA